MKKRYGIFAAIYIVVMSYTNYPHRQSDFERFQNKVDSLIHKPKRSDRENANLAKAEADLSTAKEVTQLP